MAYKIAVASSDGKNVDLHLGSSPFLKVYTAEGLSFQFLEDRKVDVSSEAEGGCQGGGCSGGNGCGCSGGGNPQSVEIVAERRLLELKAISVFDIEIPVEEALSKITSYYHKLDNRAFNIKQN